MRSSGSGLGDPQNVHSPRIVNVLGNATENARDPDDPHDPVNIAITSEGVERDPDRGGGASLLRDPLLPSSLFLSDLSRSSGSSGSVE